MNITKQIAEAIGGEIEKTILDNEEIQFYCIDSVYYWEDRRFELTNDLFHNPQFTTKLSLIRHFKKHLNQIQSKHPA